MDAPSSRPPLIEFSVPGFVSAKLAQDDIRLYQLKTGATTDQLTSAQIEKLQKGYVGKQVRLAVYEIGAYSGIPDKLPNDVTPWQDHGFGFSTSLVVLAERPP